MVLTKTIRLRFADGSERVLSEEAAARLARLLSDMTQYGATASVAAGIEHELGLRFGTRLPVDIPEQSAPGVTKALTELA